MQQYKPLQKLIMGHNGGITDGFVSEGQHGIKLTWLS